MRKGVLRGLVVTLIAAIALVVTAASPTMAQSNSSQGAVGSSAQANALKQWQAQDAHVIQCINTIYADKNITADSFVAAGVGPTDQRVAPVIKLCNVVMTAKPKTNFPCNVTSANGKQLTSTCNESYAVNVNGSWKPVSRDDFLRALGAGQQAQVLNFEVSHESMSVMNGGQNVRQSHQNFIKTGLVSDDLVQQYVKNLFSMSPIGAEDRKKAGDLEWAGIKYKYGSEGVAEQFSLLYSLESGIPNKFVYIDTASLRYLIADGKRMPFYTIIEVQGGRSDINKFVMDCPNQKKSFIDYGVMRDNRYYFNRWDVGTIFGEYPDAEIS